MLEFETEHDALIYLRDINAGDCSIKLKSFGLLYYSEGYLYNHLYWKEDYRPCF